MKKFLLSLGFAALSLTAPKAAAQAGYVYLGGALSLPHCQVMAGQAGYQLATYGGFVNGVYIINACFGSMPVGGGGGGGGGGDALAYYTVYSQRGVEPASCVRDIEFEVASVRCRVLDEFIGKIQCRARARQARTLNDIKFVGCVEDAFGPFDRPT